MTNEADCSVVLALLQVVFLGKCNDYGPCLVTAGYSGEESEVTAKLIINALR